MHRKLSYSLLQSLLKMTTNEHKSLNEVSLSHDRLFRYAPSKVEAACER